MVIVWRQPVLKELAQIGIFWISVPQHIFSLRSYRDWTLLTKAFNAAYDSIIFPLVFSESSAVSATSSVSPSSETKTLAQKQRVDGGLLLTKSDRASARLTRKPLPPSRVRVSRVGA